VGELRDRQIVMARRTAGRSQRMPGYSEARRMGVWLGRRRRATSTQDAIQALLTKSGAFYFPLSGIVCLTETVETLYLLGGAGWHRRDLQLRCASPAGSPRKPP
jgi:hypothetical protein